MATVIPHVTNWSVTPQNGNEDYFTKMNIWLSESTAVIASLNGSIDAINQAIDISILQSGAIDDNNIAINRTFSNSYIQANYYNKAATYSQTEINNKININGFTEKTTIDDTDNIGVQQSNNAFRRVSWANIKNSFMTALGYLINISTAKTTLVDNDGFVIGDSQAGSATKKVTWLSIKNNLFNGAISLGANGYIKFPTLMGGLIIQWGSVTLTTVGATLNVTFPFAFPTNCYLVVNSGNGKTGATGRQDYCATTNGWTLNGFSISQNNTFTAPAYQSWIAIGN